MKLSEIIILSLAFVFFIIGIHQTMIAGFGSAYWAIMLASILFFVFVFRRKK